jgi:TonB family protein
MQSVVRSKAKGTTIVDEEEAVTGIVAGSRPSAMPGKLGSSLELVSDPMGVDFRPYLTRVLAAVRRNWYAVIPESARLGRTGKVVIQFAISKDGSVPKLVIAEPSGADPLDRAAVAGISASNPFPPLPPEFRGSQIRLQLAFDYKTRP